MTNKRQLKKYITRVQDEVAQMVVPAAVLSGLIDESKAIESLVQLASLSIQARGRLSIGFDKNAGSYESVRAYKAARKAYFKEAYAKAVQEFEAGVNALIAPITDKK